MNKFLDQGRSPVTGGKFRILKQDYAKAKKRGNRHPNLFLEGDMRSQISFEEFRDGVEIGIFDSKESEKADNHNKNSSKSKRTAVPLRQFVPYNQKKGRRASFDVSIRDDINDLIDELVEEDDGSRN